MEQLRNGGVFLLVLAVLVAACGGEANSETTTTAAAAAVTEGADNEATTTTTEEVDAGDDDSGGVDAGGLPGLLSSNDCLQAATAMASAFSGGISSTGLIDSDEIAAGFDRMSDAAPGEIKDDLALMADALGEFYSILEDAGVDLSDPTAMADPNIQEAFISAGEKMDTEEFEQAADNVNQWFEDECAEFAG